MLVFIIKTNETMFVSLINLSYFSFILYQHMAVEVISIQRSCSEIFLETILISRTSKKVMTMKAHNMDLLRHLRCVNHISYAFVYVIIRGVIFRFVI